MTDMAPDKAPWEKRTSFAFGALWFIALFAVALLFQHPSPTSWHILNIILAMAAGGIAAIMPGTLKWNWTGGATATGALAFAAIVFYTGKGLVPDTAPPRVQDLISKIIPAEQPSACREVATGRIVGAASTKGAALPPCFADPKNSDVYVLLNPVDDSGNALGYKVVASNILSGSEEAGFERTNITNHQVDILTGPGSITVKFRRLKQGDRIIVAQTQKDPAGKSYWWESSEMEIPEAQLALSQASFGSLKNRISRAK
jgi:hypothetical protein